MASELVKRDGGMTSAATVGLTFEERTVRFVGTAERPAWVGVDVCHVLEIRNTRDALSNIPAEEKGVANIDTLGGSQDVVIVYEAGLYRLLTRSRKPVAKRFQRWLFHEVLPSIRKHGTYPPPNVPFAPTLAPYTARVMSGLKVRRAVPAGHWCVFTEAADVLIAAEPIFGEAGLKMDELDLLDGSIGAMWKTFRADQPWAGERVQYRYEFPENDHRGVVYPWSYPMAELPHFRTWLWGVYCPAHFPNYLRRKYGEAAIAKALPAFAKAGLTPCLPPATTGT